MAVSQQQTIPLRLQLLASAHSAILRTRPHPLKVVPDTDCSLPCPFNPRWSQGASETDRLASLMLIGFPMYGQREFESSVACHAVNIP